ncbi:enoyl-CoA hydratase/isomerase family protein [Kribbella sp. NPDC004875]|uniref:enoyl-CoA hydratase/isomerase family protein n=1 Tax=Kribbella sp. NPDC004875 TaxID=3364107 RepID=UPI0036AD79C9
MTTIDRTAATLDEQIPGLILTRSANGVALVELDRPHRRNALDRALLDGLPGMLQSLNDDDQVRVIVLSGRGGSFCAGGDLDVIGDMGDESPEAARTRMTREFSSVSELAGTGKPTVASVDGAAVGAGMALALACDLRVGSDAAVFSSPFIKMALVPDFGASWLLANAVGPGRATEIALTGRRVGAAEALRIGLLDTVADDCLGQALRYAGRLAEAPVAAAAATKRLIRAGATHSLNEVIDREITEQLRAVRSEAFREHWKAWSETVRGR